MTQTYERAENGNVALMGEIDLADGVQMDEAALPVLLVDLAMRNGGSTDDGA